MRIGVERSRSVLKTATAGTRSVSASETAGSRSTQTVRDAVTIAGVPEAEMTPNVRSAILRLMQEVDDLRRQLSVVQKRAEQAEKLADEDPMLPVLNRRAFVRELSRTLSLAQRYGTPSSLIYVDVNGMKPINDTYGHDAGDAVLQHVAATLADQVRQADVIGRLGGDEFGVILMHADEEVATHKAGQLVDAIRSLPVRWNGIELSISIAHGVSTLSGSEEAGQALAEADQAMYLRKGSRGR